MAVALKESEAITMRTMNDDIDHESVGRENVPATLVLLKSKPSAIMMLL